MDEKDKQYIEQRISQVEQGFEENFKQQQEHLDEISTEFKSFINSLNEQLNLAFNLFKICNECELCKGKSRNLENCILLKRYNNDGA